MQKLGNDKEPKLGNTTGGNTAGMSLTNETGEAKPNIIHTGKETITINPETERDQLQENMGNTLTSKLAKYREQREETETRQGRE